MVTHWFGLDQVADAFATATAKADDGVIKVVLTP